MRGPSRTSIKEPNEDGASAQRKESLEPEDQLTNDKLMRLQEIFLEADADGGGGLDKDEFRGAMRQTMDVAVSDKELDKIFMKVDTNCDGTVDWDEYLTYMLLVCHEKNQMEVESKQPFLGKLTDVETRHRDSIIALIFLPSLTRRSCTDKHPRDSGQIEQLLGLYASVGRDGIVQVRTTDMKVTATHRIEPHPRNNKSCSQGPLWITDAAYLARSRILVFGTTSYKLLFYLVGKHTFEPLSQVTGLCACPVALTTNEANVDDCQGLLLWGDDRGGVSGMVFHQPPSNTAINFGTTDRTKSRILFVEILSGRVADLTAFRHRNVHAKAVKRIIYNQSLKCIISCSGDTDTAMCVWDIERRTTTYYFRMHRGINDLEYFRQANVIATGGYDGTVRVWNPYVTSRPSGTLSGHTSPVLKIHSSPDKEHVISIAENKEVRVHDINSQTCVQTLFRTMLAGLGKTAITASLFQPARHELLIATNKLTWLHHPKNYDRYKQCISHAKPVSCVLYNPLFNQVVSAAGDSTVCVWSLRSGRKTMQFKAHSHWARGQRVDVPITAISFDHTYRRLVTGGNDGTVKLWNFNNGGCLSELTVYDHGREICGIACSKQNIITGGWNGRLTVYKDKGDDDAVYFLKPKHRDDITTLAHYPPALVASGSCDGQLMVYSLNTRDLLVQADVTGEKLYPKRKPGQRNRSLEIERQRQMQMGNAENAQQETIGPSPNAERSLGLKNNAKLSPAVEKLLFLPSREHSKDTASLLCACADGWIRAWSVHPDGGLKGEFWAARRLDQAICTLASALDDHILVSGDEQGYIRVWDISHFCVQGKDCTERADRELAEFWKRFTFYRWHSYLHKTDLPFDKPLPRSLPGEDSGVHLVNSFRAHVQRVTSLDVAVVSDVSSCFIVSASADRSVRLWTLFGEFVGIFGQDAGWNVATFSRNVIQDVTMQSSATASKTDGKRALPPRDVTRVASATTLNVMFGGRHNVWVDAARVTKRKAAANKNKASREEGVSNPRHSLSASVTNGPLASPLPESKKTSVLGSAFKKTTHHKPLPTLERPILSDSQCAAYRCLPYSDIKTSLPELYDEQVIMDIRRRYNLPQLEASQQRSGSKQRARLSVRKAEAVVGSAASNTGENAAEVQRRRTCPRVSSSRNRNSVHEHLRLALSGRNQREEEQAKASNLARPSARSHKSST